MNSHSPSVDELVDLAVGESPHELLVLLQPLGRELAHDQVPVIAVDGRIHRGELVAERQFVAVLVDQLAHVVVAVQRNGKSRERPRHRVARREGVGVGVHGARLVVPGDHVDALLRFAAYRALGSQPVEVRVRVVDELVATEEVDGVVVDDGVGHAVPLDGVLSVTKAATRSWNRQVPPSLWSVSW